MKKQLRKLLSALLVLTMLLSALPMGVFAEEDHVPAVVDELTEEETKELDAEPTAEPTEEPAAEPTVVPAPGAAEAPAAQPTVAPIVDSSDDALETATVGEPETEPEKEPAVEPTVAPIVDLTDDALETATAGEPETEPEKEPETTPAAEDEVDEGKPEETPAPAENNDDDTLSGLTDEQRKTLNALPEGFSADVVAFAMLRSTGCAHTLLKVSEVFDESYTSIDSKKHLFMKKNLSRKLFCSACGEALQTIELGDVEEEWSHSWYSDGNTGGSLFDFTCLDCDEKITINPPCSHGSYSLNKNRMPYCTECGAIAYPGESMTMDDLCKHTHYTVHYPNTKLTEYSRWNDASHLKTTKVAQYTDDSESSQYYPAVCNDCGADLVYLPSGKVEQLEGYDGELWGEMEYVQTASDFEVHTFANGVCKYCGEEQSEETCRHANVKQVENTAKKTIDVTPVDDAEHQITTTRYFELRCADCDAYIGEAPADVSTQNEAHVWDNKNICTKCDYGNDCTHNNSTFHHYAKGDTHTGYQWTGNGETHYVIKYEVLVECDCCLGCMRFYLSSGTDGESRKLVSAESVTREKERYTETCHITNGWTGKRYFCMYCGYEKVMCDHSSGNTVDRLDRTVEPLYSDITETTHREQYTYNRYCDDCDTYLETVLGEVLAPVAHNFGSGNTCDCGYTKTEEPCQHTETKRVENTGKRTSELKPFSETEHEVTTTKYYELHCAACDAYISDDGTDTTTEKQSHDFSSGTTCACGYTKAQETCQHVDVEVRYYPECTYTKLDAEKHICTAVYKTKTLYCNDCKQTIQTISANKTIVEEEKHSWWWVGNDFSSLNVKGSIYDFYCENCGETITLEPPCSHESLVNSDSEGLHCQVCGKDFGPDVIDGPVNECKHTSYTIIYPGVEETRYDQWNADSHLKKTMVSYYVDDDTTWGYDATCNDCGADLIYENGKIDDTIYSGRSGVDYKSIKSVFEAHSFVDGVCEHCGEKQTDESCQHTETKRVENTGKRTTELKSLNETEHEVTTTKYYELHCAACDAYISDDGTDTTTEKQSHDFSNGNTCACGYTKTEETCQHTKTKRVESVGSRKTELISLNDAEHEVKTTKTFKIRCAACDAYIRDDGTETTTVNKPHDLGNGNTCACGYTKVETPEDAPYVLGFTMSVTEIEVDGTVTFTLSIANAKDGDKLAIEMRADDKFTVDVDKEVTVKDGKASCAHKFSNTGDRSIKFRVAGGEYCAAQTLKVLPKKTGTSAITGVRVSPPINEARVEKKDGETFTVTVVCNLDTVCVEMYFGKEHNQDTYRSSKDKEYVEANGTRTFTLTYTLGGNGKRYAGDYPIVVSPFSYVDADWTKNQMGVTVNAGTLKVTHDMNGDEQCVACGYDKGKLEINEDVYVDEEGRMNFKSAKNKNEIKKPHYYVEAGSVPSDPELLAKILLQYDVRNNYGNVGLCNVYLSNATRAMGAFIPMAGDKVCRNCGKVIKVGNDYNGMTEYLKSNGLFCKCSNSEEYDSYHFPLDENTKSWADLGAGTYGNVTKWLIEHGAEFGWEVLNVPTAEAYANSDVEYLGSKNKSAVKSAIKEVNEGNLVIGVWSDWVKGSGHGFVAHPHPDDPTKLYTTQVGAWSAEYGEATREDSPMGWGNMRGEDNGWILYCVFRGVGNVK